MSLKAKLSRLKPPLDVRAIEQGVPELALGGLDTSKVHNDDDAQRQMRILRLRKRLDTLHAKPSDALKGRKSKSSHTQRRKKHGPSRQSLLPGEPYQTSVGSVQRVEKEFPVDYRYGLTPLSWGYAANTEALAFLARMPELHGIDASKFLFMDTETTGLAGGTGTIPFLIGMGTFRSDGSFVVRQLVLRGPGQERPMLRYLAQHISDCTAMVTYNGKSFDWPLLRNRFVLNRLKPPALPLHVDLLHAARRVYRRRLCGVRLVHVESEVVGFERQGDIDGALIPQRYFDYLDTGDGTLLDTVVEHNAYDLLALAALLGAMCRLVSAPEQSPQHAADYLSLASLAWRNKDYVRLADYSRRALSCARHDGQHAAAHVWLARMHSRLREFESARQAYHAALDVLGTDSDPRGGALEVHVQLAKIYEHKKRDPQTALYHAGLGAKYEGAAASRKRIARLNRQL